MVVEGQRHRRDAPLVAFNGFIKGIVGRSVDHNTVTLPTTGRIISATI
jgi:hypothetical protein